MWQFCNLTCSWLQTIELPRELAARNQQHQCVQDVQDAVHPPYSIISILHEDVIPSLACSYVDTL